MPNITENQISHADVKAIFKSAVDLRDNPTGIGKYIKGLRKDKIDINDLQQAWKDDSFPDDTRDIAAILKGHGFSDKEIKKVFGEVFDVNDDDEIEIPGATESIMQIVAYVKKYGMEQELISFLEKEYGFKESYSYPDKAMIEDVRNIFAAIVKEERSGRAKLMKTYEQTQLGRTKK